MQKICIAACLFFWLCDLENDPLMKQVQLIIFLKSIIKNTEILIEFIFLLS